MSESQESTTPGSKYKLIREVVVALLFSIAGLFGMYYWIESQAFRCGSKRSTARQTSCQLVQAVNQYNLENNKYPTQKEGLAILVKAGILKKVPKDPWGRPYVYRFPGKQDPERPDVFSKGADGKVGGTDDDKDISCE